MQTPSTKPRSSTIWIVLAVVVGVPLIAAIVYPIFARPHHGSNLTEAMCFSKLRGVAIAQLLYANDSDDHLPDSTTWADLTKGYVKAGKESYRCPAVNVSSGFGIAMDDHCSKAARSAITYPAKAALAFDSSDLGWNAHSSTLNFPTPARHSNVNNVSYADGHTKRVKS